MAKKKVNITALAREAGLPPATVHQRVSSLGWDLDKALSTPVRSLSNKKKPVVKPKVKSKSSTHKPSPVLESADMRTEQLEAELVKAKRQCKLAQAATLAVIVAVLLWAVNP